MEKVYPVSHFDCTEKLTNVQDYFDSYSELCQFVEQNDVDLPDHELLLKKFRELTDEMKFKPQQLPDMCSINALSIPGEIVPVGVFSSNKYTMKLQREYDLPEGANELECVKAKLDYYNYAPRRKELDNIMLKPNKSIQCDLSLKNVLVSVRIYQPFSATIERKFSKKMDKLKCSQEIAVLASNKLSQLRDKILCVNDNGFTLEINDLKDKASSTPKDEYPSGLIGIDDILYIDMRHKNAIDYSEVIKEWGIQKKIADFKVSSMDEVQIKDLNFRLGYPYIYQHRGNCEHIFVFSDVRLIKRSDPLCYSEYPYLLKINRYNSEQCNICHSSAAKWVCSECDRLPHDRTFLCEECFISYNYIGDEKIGDFKAYPYYNKSLVM